MNMNLDLLFATPLSLSQFDATLCEKYSEIVENDSSNEKDQFGTSYTTNDDLHEKKEYKQLVDVIEKEVHLYCKQIVGINKEDVALSCMWANSHTSGHKHHFHQHPNAFISGVVYLQIPNESEHPGDIIFNDPRVAKNMSFYDFQKEETDITKLCYLQHKSRWYVPRTGLVLIFPSWLEHGTQPYVCTSNRKRISLSFNYALKKCSFHTMRIK